MSRSPPLVLADSTVTGIHMDVTMLRLCMHYSYSVALWCLRCRRFVGEIQQLSSYRLRIWAKRSAHQHWPIRRSSRTSVAGSPLIYSVGVSPPITTCGAICVGSVSPRKNWYGLQSIHVHQM